MSVFNIPLEIVIFSVLAAAAVISSILVVEHESLVYAACFLAAVGMANAALFALLGFSFVALFHLAVYVGAAVVFILFSITMLKEAPVIDVPTRTLALIVTIVVVIAFTAILSTTPYFNTPAGTLIVGYRALANTITAEFWLPLLIAALTLIITLIEAITLARREVPA